MTAEVATNSLADNETKTAPSRNFMQNTARGPQVRGLEDPSQNRRFTAKKKARGQIEFAEQVVWFFFSTNSALFTGSPAVYARLRFVPWSRRGGRLERTEYFAETAGREERPVFANSSDPAIRPNQIVN